jgi:hypothetical protein
LSHLGFQLVIRRHNECNGKRDDAREQHGGCNVELERQGRGVLCLLSVVAM